MGANDEVLTAVNELAQQIADDYKASIVEADAVAWGKLRDFTYNVEVKSGERYICYFIVPPEWAYVEYGRRKGKQPPTAPIEDWIRVKHIVPSGKMSVPQLAFVIARSIGEKGIAPRPLLANAIERHNADFDLTAKKIGDILSREINMIIAKV